MLTIPLLICVKGRNKSYLCLQLSLLGGAALNILLLDWLLGLIHFQ